METFLGFTTFFVKTDFYKFDFYSGFDKLRKRFLVNGLYVQQVGCKPYCALGTAEQAS
jgi:hypothetical protein